MHQKNPCISLELQKPVWRKQSLQRREVSLTLSFLSVFAKLAKLENKL